jgi:hypothetical protein
MSNGSSIEHDSTHHSLYRSPQFQLLETSMLLGTAYMPLRPTVARPKHYSPKRHYTTAEPSAQTLTPTPNLSLVSRFLCKTTKKKYLTTPPVSRGAYRVQHRLHRQHKLNTRISAPFHVNTKAMPISIEDPMRLKERCNARA